MCSPPRAGPAAVAGATPPQPVAIEVHTTGADDTGPAGRFTASGFVGEIQVRKRFSC